MNLKDFLKLLASEEQFIGINRAINESINLISLVIRFYILQELNDIKKEIIYKNH